MKGIEYVTTPITETEGSCRRPIVGIETVVLHGNPLGEMICRRNLGGSLDYHAVLNLDHNTIHEALGSGLAQGHGTNREEAIKDAFISSRDAATNYLAALDHLAKQINESEFA
ncbi:hypothetical protein [uncultured Microbulbifer sp.]|uniref:hypothetical protein n=1 Tax=uncultured Microbulbifer sp. TaxID=348147 RepID=UPI0026113E89|nr:hypothetical protein [uncultured Microbulbifer sp.]